MPRLTNRGGPLVLLGRSGDGGGPAAVSAVGGDRDEGPDGGADGGPECDEPGLFAAAETTVFGSLERRTLFSAVRYSTAWRSLNSLVAENRANSGWSRRVMLARLSECGRGPGLLAWDAFSVPRREAGRPVRTRGSGAALDGCDTGPPQSRPDGAGDGSQPVRARGWSGVARSRELTRATSPLRPRFRAVPLSTPPPPENRLLRSPTRDRINSCPS